MLQIQPWHGPIRHGLISKHRRFHRYIRGLRLNHHHCRLQFTRVSRCVGSFDSGLLLYTGVIFHLFRTLDTFRAVQELLLYFHLAIHFTSLKLLSFSQQFYMGSSRQVKRLNAVSKSPVLNSYQESISGTSSIRAYQSHQMFTHKNMSLLDVNQNCSFHEYNGYRYVYSTKYDICKYSF